LQQGLGLGRNEQGMSQALSVEKTSRRGGRIVHEKDLMPPPMFGESFKVPNSLLSKGEESTPPQIDDTDEYGDPIMKPESATEEENNKPSITDLMKNPSKVVVCQVHKKLTHSISIFDELFFLPKIVKILQIEVRSVPLC